MDTSYSETRAHIAHPIHAASAAPDAAPSGDSASLSGDGAIQGYELTREPILVAQCVTAFEAAWRAAIPHGEYMPSRR